MLLSAPRDDEAPDDRHLSAHTPEKNEELSGQVQDDIVDLWPAEEDDERMTPGEIVEAQAIVVVEPESEPQSEPEKEPEYHWSHLPSVGALLTLAKNYDMTRTQVFKELGVGEGTEIADPDEAWLKIANKHKFKPAEA